MAKIFVLTRWGLTDFVMQKFRSNYGNDGFATVDTTSNSPNSWSRDLSPFFLGPCHLYGKYDSLNMENAWQYSKVYWEYLGKNGGVTASWRNWAKAGWANPKAVRYPMGKGRKPEYSYWNGQHLDYVSARKVIYGPLYAEAVQKTEGWKRLVDLNKSKTALILLDYDAYDHRAAGMNLGEVLNSPTKKMGHAFVLAMLLKHDHALKQMELRK